MILLLAFVTFILFQFLYDMRWEGVESAPPGISLHGLFSYCVNLALSCHLIKCTDLHPISLAWKKSYLYESYHIHFLLRLCWVNCVEAVDQGGGQFVSEKTYNSHRGQTVDNIKRLLTKMLVLQTTHSENWNMLCHVKSTACLIFLL